MVLMVREFFDCTCILVITLKHIEMETLHMDVILLQSRRWLMGCFNIIQKCFVSCQDMDEITNSVHLVVIILLVRPVRLCKLIS